MRMVVKGFGSRLAALVAATYLALLAGCGDPYTMYQAPGGQQVAEGQSIMVMPFMDTRTLQVKDDPRNQDLGVYMRDLFVEVMRQNPQGASATILTPEMDTPDRSLTNAEVAELGRQHGADVVIVGQVFSFTDTRAASIPARAGMFVRVISAQTGALLFVGDHYHAASVPMAGGNRDQQAKMVSARLIEGLFAQTGRLVGKAGGLASTAALAMLPAAPVSVRWGKRALVGNNAASGSENDTIPGFSTGASPAPSEWEENMIPMPPPIFGLEDEAGALSPPPHPAGGEPAAHAIETPQLMEVEAPGPVAANAPTPREQLAEDMPDVAFPTPAPEVEPTHSSNAQPRPPTRPAPMESVVAAAGTTSDTPMPSNLIDELPELAMERIDSVIAETDARAAVVSQVVSLSGDQLASDLFESDGEIFHTADLMPETRFAETAEPSFVTVGPGRQTDPATMAMALTLDEIAPVPVMQFSPLQLDPETMTIQRAAPVEPEPAVFTAAGGRIPAYAPLPGPITDVRARQLGIPAAVTEVAGGVSANGGDYDPIYSEPMAVEQPRTYKLLDLSEDPASERQDETARVTRPRSNASDGATRVLILPYHDRLNDNNLIANTGGGEVVTTLYGTQLALDPAVRLMWDATGLATHDRLLSIDEALELGQLAGADYVMRGQVVEFRRAQSVPSFYSAVISTAVLAAQVFFAEMSGVDVATEVYRVRDGECVMSRRDRAQQKYVVQAEKTVRRLAIGMADSVSRVIRERDPQAMDPLIDDLEPVTVLTNPR